MSTTTTPIDLQAFCGLSESGYTEPWIAGGFEYATDGLICVRVRTSKPDRGPSDGRPAPPAADIFAAHFDGADVSVSWPAGPYEAECPDCLGLGFKRCKACGHEDECTLCEGYGRYAPELPGGVKIRAKHADCIHYLPGVRYAKVSRGKPMPFRFDGGEGVVLTLRE